MATSRRMLRLSEFTSRQASFPLDTCNLNILLHYLPNPNKMGWWLRPQNPFSSISFFLERGIGKQEGTLRVVRAITYVGRKEKRPIRVPPMCRIPRFTVYYSGQLYAHLCVHLPVYAHMYLRFLRGNKERSIILFRRPSNY